MRRVRRPPAIVTGAREARAIAANLGRDTKATRRKRHLTQAELGALVDLRQSQVSFLERGHGARTSVETWIAIGIALRRPIAIGFGRDVVAPLNDAGHLEAQELVARVATEGGWRVRFEAVDDPRAPTANTDLHLTHAADVVLVEIWNRLDDLGAAARSSDRKLAVASGRARSLWLLTDTAANRAIVGRYPTILRARFPGSSAAWVRALTIGTPPPVAAGIAWIDVRTGRLRELRFRAAAG
jgi:transcriptional regulator with XRE-family HTH domain